jgi:hypothetical protein
MDNWGFARAPIQARKATQLPHNSCVTMPWRFSRLGRFVQPLFLFLQREEIERRLAFARSLVNANNLSHS